MKKQLTEENQNLVIYFEKVSFPVQETVIFFSVCNNINYQVTNTNLVVSLSKAKCKFANLITFMIEWMK